MTRSLTIALLAVGVCLASVRAQQPTGAPLEIRALSAKAELVSGGDVLVEIAGPADLNAGNVTVKDGVLQRPPTTWLTFTGEPLGTR